MRRRKRNVQNESTRQTHSIDVDDHVGLLRSDEEVSQLFDASELGCSAALLVELCSSPQLRFRTKAKGRISEIIEVVCVVADRVWRTALCRRRNEDGLSCTSAPSRSARGAQTHREAHVGDLLNLRPV